MIYMKIFISGAITNIPNYEEKFNEAHNFLQNKFPNAIILNPTILPRGLNDSQYMSIDFAMIDCCDTVFILDNYKNSRGANLELHYATYCGKNIIYQGEMENEC